MDLSFQMKSEPSKMRSEDKEKKKNALWANVPVSASLSSSSGASQGVL